MACPTRFTAHQFSLEWEKMMESRSERQPFNYGKCFVKIAFVATNLWWKEKHFFWSFSVNLSFRLFPSSSASLLRVSFKWGWNVCIQIGMFGCESGKWVMLNRLLNSRLRRFNWWYFFQQVKSRRYKLFWFNFLFLQKWAILVAKTIRILEGKN